MMRTFFFSIFIPFAIVPFVWGQKDLSGVYASESGIKIVIRDNMFYYIIPQSETPIYYNDTLAKCTIQWIDENFIELNSKSPREVGYEGFKISQTCDSSIKDSIKIYFSIPYQGDDLNISVHTELFKYFNLHYSRKNKKLMIPYGTKKLVFTISPKGKPISHDAEELFYGALYFSSFEHEIEKDINCINIEIPGLDDFFFERCFIKGEYAKISKSSIVWKGKIYKKKK